MRGPVIVGRSCLADQVEAQKLEHPVETQSRAFDAASFALAIGMNRATQFAGRPFGPDGNVGIAADRALFVKVEKQQAGAMVALVLVVCDKVAHRLDGERSGQGIDRGVNLRVAQKFVEGRGILDSRDAGRCIFRRDRAGAADRRANGIGFLACDSPSGDRNIAPVCHNIHPAFARVRRHGRG